MHLLQQQASLQNGVHSASTSIPLHGEEWGFTETPSEIGAQGKHGRLYTVFLNPNSLAGKRQRPGERYAWLERSMGRLLIDQRSAVLCLHRFKVWWMRPVFSAAAAQIPPETVLALFRDHESDRFRLILPVERTTLQPGPAKGTVQIVSELPAVSIYSGVSVDPFSLLREGVSMIARASSLPLRSSHSHNTLGWCTWNAFYTQVTGPKLVDAAQHLLEERQVPVKWMVIDDGWQHTTNDNANNGKQWNQRLQSLRESPTKFQQLSLKDTISRLHAMGMDQVWVWHTLAGYWMGLNPLSPSLPTSTLQHTNFPSGIMDNDNSAQREPSVDAGVGIPEKATDFYEQYHSYLANCGVDGVKVDAQGVIGVLRTQRPGPTSHIDLKPAVDDLQNALAASVNNRFHRDGNYNGNDDSDEKLLLIQCMAHDPQILYGIPKRYSNRLPLVRASDDHYPDNEYSHGPHIVACAFNSLLLGRLALPDWDMFRTDLEHEWSVRLHAVSRCVSGGPVYISDPPHHIRKDVVDWIACRDGTVLTCTDTALPTASSLMQDPLQPNAKPLVLHNTNGMANSITSGVLGVFSLAGSGTWDYTVLDYVETDRPGQVETATLSPNLVPQLSSMMDTSFLAVPFFDKKHAWLLDSPTASFKMQLENLACDAVALVPITTLIHGTVQIAPLGYRSMINGVGAILKRVVYDERIELTIVGCGDFVVALRGEADPTVYINKQPIEYIYGLPNEQDEEDTPHTGVMQLGFRLLTVRIQPSSEKQQQLTLRFRIHT